MCVTINANLFERTSRPNCQACSGRLAGNWRGHSRESIYSDKRLVVSGKGRQEKAPWDPCIRNEAFTSLGSRSSLAWALVKQMQMKIVSKCIYPP